MDLEPESMQSMSANYGDYEDMMSNIDALKNILESEPNSAEFTKFVYNLAAEIKKLCDLQHTINFMKYSDDYTAFVRELIFFLREMGCPYRRLITDTVFYHLQSRHGRLLLLEYLIIELLVARILNINCLKDNHVARIELANEAYPAATDMKNILVALILKQKPPNVTPEIFYLMMESKIKYMAERAGVESVDELLYRALPYKNFKSLDNDFAIMYAEYRDLREALITKLSFIVKQAAQWDPPDLDNDIVVSGVSPFEEAVLRAQGFNITEFFAIRTSVLDLRNNFINEIRKNYESAMAAGPPSLNTQSPRNEQNSLRYNKDLYEVKHVPEEKNSAGHPFLKKSNYDNNYPSGSGGKGNNQKYKKTAKPYTDLMRSQELENNLGGERGVGTQRVYNEDMGEFSHENAMNPGNKFSARNNNDGEDHSGLAHCMSALNIEKSTESGAEGMNVPHPSDAPLSNDSSTSQPNDLGRPNETGNGSKYRNYKKNNRRSSTLARSRRNSENNRDSRHGSREPSPCETIGRSFTYSFVVRGVMSIPTRYRVVRGTGEIVAIGGQGRHFNGIFQGRLSFVNERLFANQDYLPMEYYHSFQITMYIQNGLIIYEINNVFFYTYI